MVYAPILNVSGADALQRGGRAMGRVGLDIADWPLPRDTTSESWVGDAAADDIEFTAEPQDTAGLRDPLGAVRGMLLAVAISVPMWAVIYWAIKLVVR